MGDWVSWWVDGWVCWRMYGCDCMRGWLGVCVDGVWSLWRGLIFRSLGLFVVLWFYLFDVGLINGQDVGWVDGWVGGWMYGCDCMRGWVSVCVDGVWSLWRGLVSRKLGLFVVLWCYCFDVVWVNG